MKIDRLPTRIWDEFSNEMVDTEAYLRPIFGYSIGRRLSILGSVCGGIGEMLQACFIAYGQEGVQLQSNLICFYRFVQKVWGNAGVILKATRWLFSKKLTTSLANCKYDCNLNDTALSEV